MSSLKLKIDMQDQRLLDVGTMHEFELHDIVEDRTLIMYNCDTWNIWHLEGSLAEDDLKKLKPVGTFKWSKIDEAESAKRIRKNRFIFEKSTIIVD